MSRDRQTEELEAALAARIGRPTITGAGAGKLLRALPGAALRTLRFRADYAVKTRRARRVRSERSSGSGDDAWTAGAATKIARFESLAAVVGDELFVLSGFMHGERINEATLVYRPDSDAWSERTPMPIPVTHAAVGVEESRIWIMGGFIGDHPGLPTSRVQMYDTLSDTWHEGPPLPVSRGSNAGAFVAGRLHCFGGTKPDRETDSEDHFTLDPAAPDGGWESAAPLPEPRNHLAAVAVGGLVYAIGGQRGHDLSTEDLAFTHAYDPNTDSWQRRADLPSARNHCEAAAFGWQGRIFVAGGFDSWRDLAPHSSIVRYDPETDAWSEAGSLPAPRVGPVVQMVGDTLIAASGAVNLNHPPDAETWIHRSPSDLLAPPAGAASR